MRRGTLICFIGVDGSGKTTLARSLERHLKDSGKSCKYIWCGWRGFESFLFKPIVKIIKKIIYNSGKYGPNPKTNVNTLSYFALVDYLLRVLPDVFLSLCRYDYVIADRYIYDVSVGFSSLRGKSKTNLFKRIFWLFPKPDIVFFIDIPEHIAYTRKGDVPSVDYLAKQRAMYLKLIEEYDIRVLDGTKSKEELLNVVKMEVTKNG